MNAFAAAMAVLHADPNLSTAATYYPNPDRPASRWLVADHGAGSYVVSAATYDVRVILSQPRQEAIGFRAIAGRVEASIETAVLPWEPARGDWLVAGASSWRVEAAECDVLATSWRLTLAVETAPIGTILDQTFVLDSSLLP